MASLNKKQKYFIVRSLAVFNTPQETVTLVKEEFNIDVSRQQVESYDPTKRAGKDLSIELKGEFELARKEFLDTPQNIPIANLSVRLQRLENQYQKHGKNRVAALSILKQAAQDLGGQFTNRQEITGKGGGPIESVNANVSTESYLEAREQVLNEY